MVANGKSRPIYIPYDINLQLFKRLTQQLLDVHLAKAGLPETSRHNVRLFGHIVQSWV